MVAQDYSDDDLLHLIDPQVLEQADFLGIEDISEFIPEFDSTKLMENNVETVGLLVPPIRVTEPVADSTQVLESGTISPEMILLQPATPAPSVESALSPYSVQSFTSDSSYSQPATPEPFSVEPVTPGQYSLVTLSTQCSTLDSGVLSSVESVASPHSVQLQEEVAPFQSSCDAPDVPKKRGRKRKDLEGASPSSIRPKKPKVYEISGPLLDEKAEKKRKNAVNAKRHRDMQKNERDRLSQELKLAKAEIDRLRKREQQLIQAEAQLRQILVSQAHQNYVLM